MIESDAWCPDVVTQVGLITRALGLLPAGSWLARARSRFYCICSSCQWIRMPAMAPKATRAGSGILRQRSRPRETAAMAAVGMSVMVWRLRTTTAPAMAPAAAAVAPLTKALIWGGSRGRMNQRPGTVTPREMGMKMAVVAMRAPGRPAAREPRKVAGVKTGPAGMRPNATAALNLPQG